MIAGLVGSIDNDMIGTDMTIGADSALHRIVEAIDAIASTAASHQRSFVVEVMGRHCGYLALMSAIAGGADYVFIPENPPDPGWEDDLCELLKNGRAAGRRNSIVIVAEGAQDSQNNPITSDYVRQVLEDRLGEDTRVTILGHVQRGGAPSAFDRSMSSMLGLRGRRGGAGRDRRQRPATDRDPGQPGVQGAADGMRRQDPRAGRADRRQGLRHRADDARRRLHRDGARLPLDLPRPAVASGARAGPPGSRIVNVGGLAPGMNAAARAAVRLGLHRGHTMLGVYGSFRGLIDGDVRELHWGDVEGWGGRGGAELGISRDVPTVKDLYAIGRGLEQHDIDGLLIIGGWDAFEAAHTMHAGAGSLPRVQDPDDLPAGHHRQQHARTRSCRSARTAR